MGASTELATPAFDSAAARERYEAAYQQLHSRLESFTPIELAHAFIDLEAQMDAGMIEVKTAMLTSGLFAGDDEQALGVWIHRQHANLAQIGARATQACLEEPGFDTSRAMRVLALTFLHWGEAVKWELMVGRQGRREYKLGNALMQMAIDKGRQHESGELTVDGLRRWSSIGQLFLRMHLLDRFTSGNLTAPQIEVLDAWLWEWAPALAGTLRYPGGGVLRADLDCDHGLRHGQRMNDRPAFYLALAPLEERRKAIIKELHRGRIVPEQGRAANVRVEAHVAVLQQLRRLFAGVGSEGRPRATRHVTAPGNVEVVVGLEEILRELRAMPPQDVERKPRLMALKNVSSSGHLLEAAPRDAEGISLGELLGLRPGPGQPMLLARVVRRVNELGRGIQLGVQLLSDAAWPIKVATFVSSDMATGDFIFVPGPDASGRFDSFAVPYGALKDDVRYRIRAGADVYSLAFNRVHRRGIGWAMAGFEVIPIPAESGGPAPTTQS